MAVVHYEFDGSHKQREVEAKDLSFSEEKGLWVMEAEDEVVYLPRDRVYEVIIEQNESEETEGASESGVSYI